MEQAQLIDGQKGTVVQQHTAPTFDIFNTHGGGRPISQPDVENPFATRRNQGVTDPIFGNSKSKFSPQDIFSNLGNRNYEGGLWTTGHREVPDTDEDGQKPGW